MRRLGLSHALIALASLLGACSDQTSLLVEVSSPLAIPGDVNGLELRVVGDVEGRMVDRTYPLASDWPHSVSLRPGAVENQGVTITVTATLDGGFVARRVVQDSFVRGEQRVVRIVIDAECAGVQCGEGIDCIGGRCQQSMPDGGMDAGRTPDGGTDAGPECTSSAECDDLVNCTRDTCMDGACVNEPDDTICVPGETCDPVMGCPPVVCATPEECNDFRVCNGEETCTDMACTPVSGTAIDCNDSDPCTADRCSEAMRGDCVHTTADRDEDGFGDATCAEVGGVPATDCNDDNPDVNPDAVEVCDGFDNDCNGTCDDAFTCCRGEVGTCTSSCGTPGTRVCGSSCSWGVCSPPAEECNAVDDDCNGAADDVFACVQGATASCTTSCGSTGMRTCQSDCTWSDCVAPAETCNGRDDDCDGTPDEGFSCVAGSGVSCTTSCGSTGTQTCSATCTMGACVPPAEGCTGMDDDCDGEVDETVECSAGAMESCTTSCGSTGTRTCSAACTFGSCTPPSEVCNGADDDCDGRIDETFTCVPSAIGTCTSSCGTTGTRTCTSSCTWGSCTPPVEACNGLDDNCNSKCDESFACCAGRTSTCTTTCGSIGSRTCSSTCTNGTCNPPAEICNGADDDCDGMIDDGFACTPGATQACTTSCGSVGTQSCQADCTFGSCSPPMESCNGTDDDCDGTIDEGCGSCSGCTGAVGVSAPGGRYDVPLGAHVHSGSCGGSGGSEGYLTFTLATASDVFITTHHAGSTDTVLYVRDCTCGGPEISGACNDNADGRTTSRLRLLNLPAGTYNVVVDTKTTTSGSIPVDVYITTPGAESDRCGNPTFITAGTTTLTGNTCSFAADYTPAVVTGCPYIGSGGAQDRVFYFYVPTSRTVTVSGCTAGSLYDQTAYVRTVCTDGSASAQPACNDDGCGGPAQCDRALRSAFSTTLGPGLYYFVVDGYQGGTCDCGAYELSITGL